MPIPTLFHLPIRTAQSTDPQEVSQPTRAWSEAEHTSRLPFRLNPWTRDNRVWEVPYRRPKSVPFRVAGEAGWRSRPGRGHPRKEDGLTRSKGGENRKLPRLGRLSSVRKPFSLIFLIGIWRFSLTGGSGAESRLPGSKAVHRACSTLPGGFSLSTFISHL